MIDASSTLILNPGSSPFFTARGAHVRCEQGRITDIGPHLQPRPHEHCIDAQGGALLPGLHDQHIHLLATAAARDSFDCAAATATDFIDRLEQHAEQKRNQPDATPWVRAVNYNESIAGDLTRERLDRWLPAQPIRVQHSTGSMWVLNSKAITLLNLNGLDDERLERDANNQLTGRLFRADDLLRERLQMTDTAKVPDLHALSRELASFGIVSVTDTSATNGADEFELLHRKQQRGELLQRVRLMGRADLPQARQAFIHTGELKLLLDEAALPDLDQLIDQVAAAHLEKRAVAFHCVTRIELAVVIGVLNATGVYHDRIEHGSIIPTNTIEPLRELGVKVVTQPGLIHTRGDRYLRDLGPTDLNALYRIGSLLNSGITVAGSSDAPYGPLNPWLTMQCAIDRATATGAHIGRQEAISAEQAIALFCADGAIIQGQPADLCLLVESWTRASARLADATVTHTLRAGELIHADASSSL